MYLHDLPKRKNRKKKAKRLGRGYGSGVGGHTVGRGTKGQKSRAGHKSLVGFEGGQTPFFRRMPKYPGFKPLNKTTNVAVNLDVISSNYKSGEKVSLESLKTKGLIGKKVEDVKILGNGEIKKKVTIEGLQMSKNAQEKIIKAGGSIK
ncbi:MAG: 50S ribosomal protein L15 [candidate division WS6 bacterium 34_10]|jgi:large subunit ribosomal protein L15|uniref:Large ribosomal subunit protein uL15 n=1 Tax=candidate division WS6 bacterium 34_10 TaxID=1641389 RepID=A0A101HHJ3_9BACT|nr:MAG: 50S ribosomal protein L15 [candidate division WS6 bacterium 34_10]